MTKPSTSNATMPVPTVAIPRYRLERYNKYVIDSTTEFVAKSSDETGHVLRRVDNPDLCESFTHEEFHHLLQKNRLCIIRNYFQAGTAAIRAASSEVLISDLQPKARRKLLARKQICDAFLRAEAAGLTSRSDKSMKKFIDGYVSDRIKTALAEGRCGSDNILVERPPSTTTMRRWLRIYEACSFNAMALGDGYGRSGNRTSRIETEERALMREIAQEYASCLRPTKASQYRKLVGEIKDRNETRKAAGQPQLRTPSRMAFDRVIARLDPFLVYAGREGEAAARKKFYIVREGLDVSRPLERVEIDDWNISLQTILEDAKIWQRLSHAQKRTVARRRLWLSAVIDTYTRYVLAVRVVDEPSASAAVAAIEMAVNDKSRYAQDAGCQTPWEGCGRMETVAADNGSAFKAYETQAAVTDLGAEILFPPAGTPQNRARIERFFRTIHDQLAAMFHGRSFENILAKGDYNSEANAVINAGELARVIVRWVVDVYHNTPHEGLGGETPRNCWLRTTKLHPVLPPPSEDENRHIFGITVERRITNSGVRVLGLNYQSEALQRFRRTAHQKPVLLRIDRSDLGYVSVRVEKGWMTVGCQRPGLDGVSVSMWIAAQKAIRREHASNAKLSEDIVFKALRDIAEFSDAATERAGIASPIMSSVEIDRHEHGLFRHFSFDRGPEEGPPVLNEVDRPQKEVKPDDTGSPAPANGEDDDTSSPAPGDGEDDGDLNYYGMED